MERNIALKRPKWKPGTLVLLEHVSKVLEGNALGAPHVGSLAMWLPPQYDEGATRGRGRRFPVLVDMVGAGEAEQFVRLETQQGALLLAAAQAGGLAPDDGSDPWLPFSLAVGVDSCMSEETACGATRRTAVELRRAGGAPRLVFDAQWSAVGDRGEAQLWVAAPQTGDEGCLGASGAWYAVGLMAAR